MSKRCLRCDETKPVEQFYRNRTHRDGRESYCKSCADEKVRAWCKANPEKRKEYTRTTNTRRRHKIRAWEREHSLPCIDCGKPAPSSWRQRMTNPKSPYVRCRSCANARRQKQAHERTARWLALRHQGLNNVQIAEREGVAEHVVAHILQRSQVGRFPDLEWVRSPYNRPKVAA